MSNSNTKRRKLKKRAQAIRGRGNAVFDPALRKRATQMWLDELTAVTGKLEVYHFDREAFARVMEPVVAPTQGHRVPQFFGVTGEPNFLKSDYLGDRRFVTTPIGRGKFERQRPNYRMPGKSFLAANFAMQAEMAARMATVVESETSANLRRGGFEQVSPGRWLHPDGRLVFIDR